LRFPLTLFDGTFSTEPSGGVFSLLVPVRCCAVPFVSDFLEAEVPVVLLVEAKVVLIVGGVAGLVVGDLEGSLAVGLESGDISSSEGKSSKTLARLFALLGRGAGGGGFIGDTGKSNDRATFPNRFIGRLKLTENGSAGESRGCNISGESDTSGRGGCDIGKASEFGCSNSPELDKLKFAKFPVNMEYRKKEDELSLRFCFCA